MKVATKSLMATACLVIGVMYGSNRADANPNPCKSPSTCSGDATGVCHNEGNIFTHCTATLDGTVAWDGHSVKGAVGQGCGAKFEGPTNANCEAAPSKDGSGNQLRCSSPSYITGICD